MPPTLLSLLLSVVIIATTVAPALSQAPVDPQSLVGNWSGRWSMRNPQGHQVSGQYDVSITKVEGDKVYAHVDAAGGSGGRGPGAPPVVGDFVGTLDGNRLTLGNDELTVDGSRMKGRKGGTSFLSEIDLAKKK